jgi:hypothetical protein
VKDLPVPEGRNLSFDFAIDLLRKPNPVIVEFGMTRLDDNWNGDGWSTPLFGKTIALYGGKFISVDINGDCIPVVKKIYGDYEIPMKNVFLVCADAIDFIDTFNFDRVDLLYLDAWDYTGTPEDLDKSMTMHVVAFIKAHKWLKSGSLILIDDVHDVDTFEGKGKYLIPYLIDIGYEVCYKGYQYLLRKP